MSEAVHFDDIVDLIVYQDQLILRFRHGGYRRVTGAEMDVLLKAIQQYNLDKRVSS